MKHLSVPTSNLPNGRSVIDRSFLEEAVAAVNELNAAVESLETAMKSLQRRLDVAHSNAEAERGERRYEDSVLLNRLKASEKAISKMASAFEVLVGGSGK